MKYELISTTIFLFVAMDTCNGFLFTIEYGGIAAGNSINILMHCWYSYGVLKQTTFRFTQFFQNMKFLLMFFDYYLNNNIQLIIFQIQEASWSTILSLVQKKVEVLLTWSFCVWYSFLKLKLVNKLPEFSMENFHKFLYVDPWYVFSSVEHCFQRNSFCCE